MENHKYSLNELDSMIPWEREVYIAMLMEDLKQKAERQRQMQGIA